ncbi:MULTISPECIES: PIN domain-containing protein [Nitrospirillum]|uniref:Putative nucleic acid-binding protein n=1 Tax=Nitrospirillum amazonense TaxID=28077 RepID=A0A560G1S8_9PROT|nr:PIN domain-containing protein [Nitrospirillum amazonense]MEC4589394.1 PIN domain-containing protein [Nitrospirillum amazonense]TWB27799.1 putative nucleic acid-binding protein [Nitrospirillum amazonense]
MRFTIDTNVLVYAADNQAGERHRKAVDVLARARGRDCVLTVQALAELFRALTGRHKVPAARAAAMVQVWRDAMPVVAADEICLVEAMDAVAAHNWSFWDAMMWATAKRAGCRLLITEDGQDGRALGGVTLVNPFADSPSPLLETALGRKT